MAKKCRCAKWSKGRSKKCLKRKPKGCTPKRRK